MMGSWDNYFMTVAKTVAMNSKCLSRKIGAILVMDKSIISTGFNGPPRNTLHCENRNTNGEIICPRKLLGYKSGEGLHLCVAGHAERNAIVNAARMGICVKDSIMYCYCGVPCKDCLIEIINAGIKEVVYKIDGGTENKGIYYDDISEWIIENTYPRLLVRGINYENV